MPTSKDLKKIGRLTQKERVMRRLEGSPVDKIPNLNIIMTFAAKYIGVPYKEYVTDFRKLVEGNIRCCNDFGIDMVSAISDPFRESSGFGANIVFPEDDVPKCTDFFLKEYSDIKRLKVRDPYDSDRMNDRINAVKLYRKEVGKQYPILGWVEGALAEATDLRGMGKLMTDIYDKPDFIEELLEICTEQAILFANSQIEAGADFIGVGDAAASLVGPQYYQDKVLKYEQRLIDKIHEKGVKVKLHICGNVSSILEYLPLTGADMVDIDWMVDFEKANRIFEGRCSACGNFDPVSIMLNGSTQKVDDYVRECVKVGNNTTFIAAGCEVPKMTPLQNMQQVDHSLKEIGSQ